MVQTPYFIINSYFYTRSSTNEYFINKFSIFMEKTVVIQYTIAWTMQYLEWMQCEPLHACEGQSAA